MSIAKRRLLVADIALIPIIPLLFLYNQNEKFLSLAQVALACLCLSILVIGFFFLFRAAFQTNTAAFLACFVLVVTLFVMNVCYPKLSFGFARSVFLLPIPIGYIAGYLYSKLLYKKELDILPALTSMFVAIMLLMNLFPLLFGRREADSTGAIKYKTEFVTDSASPAPNVYWFLCDGMLGFDAMEKYFDDPQEQLTEALTERGFGIDKSAKFEAGHWTRIAIPTLMCPDYYDKYLSKKLTSNEAAVQLREKTGTGLDNAREYNETIYAFRAKGYTTATISINGQYFYPITDYFYYICARCIMEKDFVADASLVANVQKGDRSVDESRLYAYQLGEIFLGGIPGILYDKLFPNSDIVEQPLRTEFAGASDVLLNSEYGKINNALVTSLYDVIHSPTVNEPKFVVIHDFLAHYPFDMDADGNRVEDDTNILSYPGQHTYAGKVLVNMIDLILEADPDAVIVLQADHGLHMLSAEQIDKALGAGSSVDIWNSVFSAIRVPKEYQTSDEQYALTNPLNISRYLVNRFVGENYDYLPAAAGGKD